MLLSVARCFSLALALHVTSAGAAPAAPAEPLVPASRFPELSWRLVGPFRGGWSTMVVGVPGQPDLYYSGTAGGGVWKTIDSGRTWTAITDGQPIVAVGALAVAPSDPSTLYVGTGHPEPRYDVIAGTGLYRSTDAGRTWEPAGLAGTRHIGAVHVDPRDPRTVVVAALGHLFGPGSERGVYRTTDGGRTWTRALYVDDHTGAVDLAVDPGNPDVLFASTWTARMWPWLSYFTPVEGPGSAVWRSADGGRTWSKLGGEGWPAGELGRIGLAAARAAGGTRLYASVAKSGKGAGLYRSDDGGGHWRKTSDAGWVTNWYMSRLTVSPTDPEVLYTSGQSIRVSRDGGTTFRVLRGAPGGDDFHFLWIDPRDPKRMAAGADQGTIITVDGGATWSEWYNQPTGQFYYLAADSHFPYRIYSGQQDSGTVRINSRSDYGSIGVRDWLSVGGDERDYDIPDPDDEDVVYGSGLGGALSRWTARTGEVQEVAPWPVASYAKRPTDWRYHYSWFTPLAVSRATPKGRRHALYVGAQVLFRSVDQGEHWEVISPDLSGASGQPQDCGGSPDVARAYACGFGVINTINPSPRNDAELWVGTDDGRLWLTTDGGKKWRLVTPPGVPRWAKIASVDPSPLRDGTAYVAVDDHRQDDFTPHAWRTDDYGAHWTDLAAELPRDHYVSVVRADTVRPGLLYAGTDVGVLVSFDDGQHWQSLQRNLPPAWAHDLLVHGRDLVVATVGRALWVLDDLTPLRQVAAGEAAREAVLYAPAPAHRLPVSQNHDTPPPPETPLGRNPPTGAVIDYWLPAPARGPVVLEVHDSRGRLVRRIASDDRDEPPVERYFEERWTREPARPEVAAGANRFVWNLRWPRPRAIEYRYGINATLAEGAPVVPAGMMALPGDYRVTLTADGQRREVPLKILADPREPGAVGALEAGFELWRELSAELDHAWRGNAEVHAVRAQVQERRAAASAGVARVLEDLEHELDSLVATKTERDVSFAQQGAVLGDLVAALEATSRAPTAPQREVARLARERLAQASSRWQALVRDELPKVAKALAAAGLAPVTVPPPAELRAPAGGESEDLP
jgi:photosystem II stability/assembly factor-like uncharacterized protein